MIKLFLLLLITVTLQTCPFNFGTTDLQLLAYSTVTSTGPSVTGRVGVFPGTSVVGFPPAITLPIPNDIHLADSIAQQGQVDALSMYGYWTSQTCTTNYGSGQDIGGLTLTPGVYCFAGSAQITGTVTLDGQSDPNAKWIFITASSLTTASNSKVIQTNGGTPCQVAWAIGSSATIGTGSQFIGSIIASASITFTTGATNIGRLWAMGGAVTVDSMIASIPDPIIPPVVANCTLVVQNVTNYIVLTYPDIVSNRTSRFTCQNCTFTNTTTSTTTSTNVCGYSNTDVNFIIDDCIGPAPSNAVTLSYPPKPSMCDSVCKVCDITMSPISCTFRCVKPSRHCRQDNSDDIWFWLFMVLLVIVGLIFLLLFLCYHNKTGLWRDLEYYKVSTTEI
jgi:hypothetical protein